MFQQHLDDLFLHDVELTLFQLRGLLESNTVVFVLADRTDEVQSSVVTVIR